MNIQSFLPEDTLIQFNKYRNYIFAIILVIGGIIAFAVYQYFDSIKREESAQMALAETLQEFQRAQQMPELWNDVEIAAKTAYRQYRKAHLAPYFLSLHAHALAELGKLNEAIDIMKQALSSMNGSSPLYYVFAIKMARMKLDAGDEQMRTEGLAELEKLAHDQKNLQQDEALYYLGNYYKNNNAPEKAQEIWKQLIERFASDKMQSPWVSMAQKGIEELR